MLLGLEFILKQAGRDATEGFVINMIHKIDLKRTRMKGREAGLALSGRKKSRIQKN